jgi:cell division protein FtsI (penicillin-binding protein 3)
VFHAYLQRFGFGSRLGLFTGPDGQRLAGEAEGLLHAPEDWTPVDHAAIAFGHGILVSPLQMITAINAIANGGELLMPILVREVRGPDGQVVQRQERRVLRRIVSRATADQLVEYMEAVPREGGTGTAAALANYTVAGKTGTTEKYDLQARGYSKTRLIASFVGFVPSRDPALTILVLVEEPQRGQSGGTVAAPIFRDIAARALPLLGVWPPEQVRHLSLDAARNAARAAGTSGGSAASP